MKTNLEIAAHLESIADLYRMKEDEQRGFSFSKAAASIRSYPTTIAEMRLGSGAIKYVGPSTLAVVEEFLKNGTTKRYIDLSAEVGLPPEEVQELTKIPGVGIVKATKLWKEHGITSLKQLEETLANGTLVDEKLRKAFEFSRDQKERISLAEAEAIAKPIIEALSKFLKKDESNPIGGYVKLVKRIEVAGSLRRKKETIKDVDIICATATDFDRHYLRELIRSSWPEDIVADGETRTRLRITGRGVDIIYTTLDQFGACLNYLTGSKDHNIRLRDHAKALGYKINEYNVTSGKEPNVKHHLIREEKDLFDLLGIWYVPPEMRETATAVNYAIQLRDMQKVEGMTFEKAISLREQHGIINKDEYEIWKSAKVS
jgi:DNA polymerase (family 10)